MSGKVIYIDDFIPHKVTCCLCLNCQYRFVAVSPEVTPVEELQCPKCKQQGNTTVDNVVSLRGSNE